jgi:hypothetical protein
MRLLGVLVVAIIMYVAAPMLWQHAATAKVEQTTEAPPIVPSAPAVATVDTTDINPITPELDRDARQDQQIAIQSQAEQQMRQLQSAQDQALQASPR